jgi:hypothetical protein
LVSSLLQCCPVLTEPGTQSFHTAEAPKGSRCLEEAESNRALRHWRGLLHRSPGRDPPSLVAATLSLGTQSCSLTFGTWPSASACSALLPPSGSEGSFAGGLC